jgi:putative hydrolase of the HAD superfamily
MPDSIQAVTFDVGGTLIDPYPSVGHVYAEVAADAGHGHLEPAILEHRFRAAWKAFPRQLHNSTDWAELVDCVFDGLVLPPPSQSFFPQLYSHFSLPDAWRIHPDVMPALEALQQLNIRTAVLSNWDERLRPLLERLGLAPFFDPIIVSCEVGTAKPHPEIFRIAAAALDLSPAQILHVGDDPNFDWTGARQAGFNALLIRRSQPHDAVPHIQSLTQIPGFLNRMSPSPSHPEP